MKKNNMLEYLEKQLEKELNPYDFAIDWNTQTHTIEIIAVLYAHNNESVMVKELKNIEIEEEIIEFEDAVLLYPEGAAVENAEDFLAVLPYTGKKGLSKGMIEAIAKQLGRVLKTGEEQLVAFLQDETQEVFELSWNDAEFEKTAEQMLARENGTSMYPYPRY